MRGVLHHIMLALWMLPCLCVQGQEAQNARFDINAGRKNVALNFQLGSYNIVAEANELVHIEAEGLDIAAVSAKSPALPEVCRLLWLPQGAKLELVQLLTPDDTLLALPEGTHLAAVPTARSKDEPYTTTEACLRASQTDPLQVEPLGTVGNSQLCRLRVRPFAWLADEGRVVVHRRVDALLNVLIPADTMTWLRLEEALIVVAHNEFRQALQPFVRWKRQEGYVVREVYAPTARRDSLAPLVASAAASLPTGPMPHLLLVGDAQRLQPFLGKAQPTGFDNHVTDLYYATLDADYLPDLVVGRWPVNDSAELASIVSKTLRYEQGHDLDSGAAKRLLLVAGNESRDPAPTTTNGHVNYLGRMAATTHPDLDTLCFRNPDSGTMLDSIVGSIARGSTLLSYTAHCSQAGWTSPALRADDLDSLGTTPPMLWVNNCCMSNNFSGNCFGEQLLRLPQGGAVAVIGATNNTMWNEDYYWAVGPKYPFSLQPDVNPALPGAFDGLLGSAASNPTAGELLMAGNLAVTAFGSPYDQFYWETYCLLGDPTLHPRLGVPGNAWMSTPGGLQAGSNNLQLVATPGARVSVMQADSLLGSAVADSAGAVAVELRWCLDTGSVTLTASGAGLLPIVLDTQPAAATKPLALLALQCTDSTVACTVANLGTDTLHGVVLALLQDSTDLAVGATLSTAPATVGTLLPGQRTEAVAHYGISSLGTHPLWQAMLTASIDTHRVALAVRQPVRTALPTATFALLEADGTTARTLRPATHCLLRTSVQGALDSLHLSVAALPSGAMLADTATAARNLELPLLTPDSLTHLLLDVRLHTGTYTSHKYLYLAAGKRTDNFGQGWCGLPWQTAGTRPWTLDPDTCHSSNHSLRSGSIDYRQTSDLVLELMVLADDTVSYWARTSSEAQHDRLLFTIDGLAATSALSGNSGWRHYAVPISAGHHKLRWRYVKDESDDAGLDCAWIDDVRLPLALWDSAYGYFAQADGVGIDTTATTEISLFPNPTNGMLTLTGAAGSTVTLLDLAGREVMHRTIPPTGATATIDLTSLPVGVYLLRLATAYGISTHKIIIHRQP